jgi:hypothetical protein
MEFNTTVIGSTGRGAVYQWPKWIVSQVDALPPIIIIYTYKLWSMNLAPGGREVYERHSNR